VATERTNTRLTVENPQPTVLKRSRDRTFPQLPHLRRQLVQTGTRPGCCRGRRHARSSRRGRTASPATRYTSACSRSTSGCVAGTHVLGARAVPGRGAARPLGRDLPRRAVPARAVRCAVPRSHAARASLAVNNADLQQELPEDTSAAGRTLRPVLRSPLLISMSSRGTACLARSMQMRRTSW
jgi:hypothetical protein